MFVEPLEQRVLLTGDMEIEPDNDTITGATALTLLDDPVSSGMFTAYGDGEIDPATSGDYWSDPDYWEFPALAGDIVSIAVATPASDVDPYVELRNSADGVLSSNSDSGADTDAFISHSVIESSGNYFVRVGKAYSSTVTGAYQLRVDVARGINLESDADYSNDSIGGANLLDLDQGAPGEVVGTVSGTIMATQGTNTDEDYYSLGVLDPDNIINLDILLPSISPLVGKVRVVDSSDADLTDSDGDANDDSFTGTVVTSDEYYAVVEANSGSGPLAQYLLDIDIDDTVSPTVADVVGLPEEGETSSEVISSLSVTFSERMDPDTVLASGAFDLREAGVDGVFDFGGTSDDVIVNLVAETTFDEFARTIEFFLQEGPLSSGYYQFTIANTVEDRAGNQLDGDGSGVGGDPFVRNFWLDLPADFVLEGPDNNDISGATALPLTEDPSGSGLFLAFGLGSIDPSTDGDWWSFSGQAGDRVAISADTPNSGLRTWVGLYNSSGSRLTYNSSSGPDNDGYISDFLLPSDPTDTYYIFVQRQGGSSVGEYQLRVEKVQGIDLESDYDYSNDSIAGANLVTLTQSGNQRSGTIAGTIMARQGTNTDEDRFQLGLLNVGNVIDLQVTLPSSSSLVPLLRVIDGSETPLVDEDGDPTNGFQATVTADGEYYAEVSNEYWVYNGHRYELLSNQDWDSAEAAAVVLGGHLATIDDQSEQDWVQQTFGSQNLWIGLHDDTADADPDTFVWVDGTPVSYTNWASGYPTTSSYDGVYIYGGDGLWYNIYKTWTGGYGLAEWTDSEGRDLAGAGPLAQYLLDITVTDPIPPQVIGVSRLPDGDTTDELISTFQVTVSEDLDPQTVNTPVYGNYAIYNGHTYVLTEGTTSSWHAGQSFAESLGGNLVTVNDAAEQQFIRDTFGSLDIWIGLNDLATQFDYEWVDGTPYDDGVDYNNFAGTEPNTASYRTIYIATGDGLWYDGNENWGGLYGLAEISAATGDNDSDGTPNEVDSHPDDPYNGWDLREAGVDGIFDSSSTPSTDDVIYDLRLASNYTSGTNISLQVYDGPMHDGDYRLTITSSLTDVVGNPLDGDGNGTGGDAYTQFFSVDLLDGYVYEGRSNNTLAEATPLTFVEDPTGSGLFLTDEFGLGSIDPSTDGDWWSFSGQAGDRVAISADTPNSGLRTWVGLYNSSGSRLTYNSSSGPDNDGYISDFLLPSDPTDTYYIFVQRQGGSSVGEYQLRVEKVQGIDLESDYDYSNDSIAGANLVTLTQSGNQRSGTIAGTIMARQGTNTDEDRFQLGLLNVGNVIDLQVTLPSSSSLVPLLRVIDGSETPLVDEDGDPTNGFQATVTADGEYYAEVSNEYWVYNGHRYELLSNQDWDSAEAAAVVLGGHLATIDDQSEQDWVQQTFGSQNLWIGLHDDTADADPDTFVWVDGTPVSYTNWASGYPTTSSYDGVYIYGGDGLWYNIYKTWTGGYGLAEWTDSEGRDLAGAGPLAQYLLDITVTDPIPPQVIGVSRLPDGDTTDELISTFQVTVSEDLDPQTVNTPVYGNYAIYNGHTYVLTEGTTSSWHAGQSFAESLGGNLVTVNDAAEQQFIRDTFGSLDIWIGLNDLATQFDYEWVDGTPYDDGVDYNNFAGTEPNTASYRTIYIATGDGLWYDGNENWGGLYGLAEISAATGDNDSDGTPNEVDSHPDDPYNGWDLREAGVDGIFDSSSTPSTDDVIYDLRLASNYTSGTNISLQVYDGPMHDGDYRLTITSSLTDVVGNPLDGDGTGSGDYVQTFSVDLPDGFVYEGRSNNTIAEATPLTLVEDPTGSGLFLPEMFGLGSQDPAEYNNYWSDPDYWSFEALAGDRVAIAVDTPDSDVDPYVELRDASDSYLTADSSSGPGSDAYISHYTILSAGTYYVRVGKYRYSSVAGSYQVRLELSRGIELESDTQYNNDSISGADLVTLVQQGNQRNGTVAGTIMAPEGTNRDEDRYQLGLLNVGNVIDLQVTLPSSSSLVPLLRVVDSSETELVDEDGDPTNGFQATVTADGQYYAEISNEYWVYNGHQYELLGNQDWVSAEAAAVDLGGHLATIDDRAEQNWVQQAFGGLHLWIGLHDADDTDTFVWVDDTLVEYTNWASGYPTSTSSYDGVYINSGNGLWYNIYKSWTGAYGLAEWIDPLGRSFAGAGPLAQYVLDITVTDPIPPVIIDVSRLPDGGTTDQLISTFNVTVSEDLDPQTVNTPVYTYAIYNGHTYLLADPSQSWNEGEAQAQALGGHLVTIDDQTEQDWIVSTFGAFSQYFWIGLTDQDEQGNWTTWADGTPVVHENWASGYPIANSGYDFGYLYTSDGFWYNYPTTTSSQWRGLIEIPTVGDSDSDGTPDEVDSHPADPFNGWDLREAGTDGVFDTGDDDVYDLRLASTYTSGTDISLRLYDGPMHDGYYQLRITSSLTDVVGNPLDGDGTGSGDYVQTFSVDLPDGFVYEGRSNNTIAEATPLTLVEDPTGSGLFLPEMFGLGSQDPAEYNNYWSDPDYWSFEALAGDRVAIAVDTPDSDVDPYVELRDASDSYLTADSSSGPGSDAYISHYTILSAGTYYVRVGKYRYSSVVGNYAVRVELARNIDLETDQDYSNDSIPGNPLTYTTVGNQRSATIAGTIMAGESGPGGVDEDYFALGTIQAGETAFSRVSLPGSSTLIPVIEIRDSSDNVVSINPNPTDASIARYDVDTTGEYYVVIVAQGGEGVFGQYLLDTTIGPTSELQFADLSVTDIELPTPPDVTTGDTIHLEWTVGNYGTTITDTDRWFDRIVLSEDDTYGDADDRYLVSVERNGTLAVNDTYVGQADITLPLDIAGSFYVFVETDEDGWVYEFTLTDNNVSQSTEQLNVNNDPPTAVPDGPYTVDEGGSVVLDGSGSSDPNQSSASLTYHWDLDYGGVTFDEDATGISPTMDASGLDGPQTLTVALRVTDAAGSSHIATTTMDVNNMPPLVAADNTTVTVDEGDTAANSGTFSDPGGDTVTLSASIGTVVDNGSGTWSWSFGTTDGSDQSQTVTITATDSDSAASSTSFSLTVDNVAPLVAADNALVSVDEGDPATNSGTFSDPGDDTVTLSASIGTVVDNGSGTWSWSFDTADGPAQSQTVTITATDSDSADRSTSFSLTVNNVLPTLTAVGNQTVDEDTELSIADLGVITDPGFDHPPLSTVESFTFSIDWGDGTAADTGSATIDDVGGVGGDLTDASCDGIHTYADHGLHTVTVRVADDDMSGNFTTGTAGVDFVEQSFQVTVNDTTPPAVSEVMVSSTGWTSDFKDAVDGVTVAGTGIGYGIPTGAHQLDPLPWINVDEVHFLFSEDVTIVQGDLGLFGVNTPDYAAQITGSVFSYDDSTFTASWTLSSSLTVDKLLAALDPTNVTDLAGNPIGTNEFRFNLLPGDANQSGVVLGSDVGQVRLNQGALGETNYSIFNDLNGSGTVLGSDVGAARLRQFDFLPAGEPSMPGSGSLALVARRFANGASASEVMSGPRLSRNSHAPRWLLERPATAAPTEAVDLALTPGASNRGGYGDQSETASLALATAGIRRDANVELEFEADPWEKVVDTLFTGLKPVFKESLD